MLNYEQITKEMTNKTPDEDQIRRIEKLREIYKEVAMAMCVHCKDGRHTRIAVTELQSSLHWAVKAIIFEFKED